MRFPFTRALVCLGVLASVFAGAGTPGALRDAGAASCARAGAGNHFAVVVDFGDAPGAPDGIFATCIDGSSQIRSGLDVLRAATGGIGQDSSGKICQIMGVPATYDPVNCSAPDGGRISYWAYFRGGANGWTYSSVGAAGVRADPEIVEGWHFVSVPASQQSSAPPPRNFVDGASYLWQSTCPAVTPPASSVAPTRPATPTTRPAAPTTQRGAPTTRPATRPIVPTTRRNQTDSASDATRPHAPSSGGDPDTGQGAPDGSAASSNGRSVTAGSAAASTSAPSGSESQGKTPNASSVPGVGGLRSNVTASRVTRRQVASGSGAGSSARPVGAIVAGVGGAGVLLVGFGMMTRRSRRRAGDGGR